MQDDQAGWQKPLGLILAGGAGRRVGGADKGLLSREDGTPMVASIAARLRPQVRRLFISCNRNHEIYARYADECFRDELPGFAGPLAGLASFPWSRWPGLLLVCPCDTPGIPDNLAKTLAAPLRDDPDLQASYIVAGDRPHYLHALLRTAALAELPDFLAGGGRAVRHWYATLRCKPVRVAPDQGAGFENLNRGL